MTPVFASELFLPGDVRHRRRRCGSMPVLRARAPMCDSWGPRTYTHRLAYGARNWSRQIRRSYTIHRMLRVCRRLKRWRWTGCNSLRSSSPATERCPSGLRSTLGKRNGRATSTHVEGPQDTRNQRFKLLEMSRDVGS